MATPLAVDDGYWLPLLNAVTVPDGVDDGKIVERLVDEYGIEIVPGLGTFEGNIFRVGCTGHSARPAKALHLVTAFGEVLANEGADVDADAGITAASSTLPD